MKLSKAQVKAHEEAMALVALERDLTDSEKEFVLDNFHEGAMHMNSAAGAFFTPRALARDFAIEVQGRTIVDLCAGIGGLAYAVEGKETSITCIEINADYVRVGKKIVPSANWIHADIFDVDFAQLGVFDCAISNPPFGNVKETGYAGLYKGSQFEYKVMEIASRFARYGVFIIPQMSANFEYSGKLSFREIESPKATAFREQTNIVMQPNCGIDTSIYKDQWRGVSPICEIVICEFPEIDDSQEQMESVQADLFSLLAA